MQCKKKLDVVLVWHMHQPHYKDQSNGDYRLPWTYLHAIKDYVDMAAHLEACPNACSVVNFSPTLLEQIDDYAQQTQRYLKDGTLVKDPLLNALATGKFPKDAEKRSALILSCIRANEEHAIGRYKEFQQLTRMIGDPETLPERSNYLSNQFIADLLVWYHLVWIGETVRRKNGRIIQLIEKGQFFTPDDRHQLFCVISKLLSGLIDRYKALAVRGQAELSFTPYSHPIMPLLLDFGSARQAWPDIVLPDAEKYPGGKVRAHWHIDQGIACFERYFGFKPTGCWPAEGGICEKSLQLLGEHGLEWAATGENVLINSLNDEEKSVPDKIWLYQSYLAPKSDIACFFRDDGLSDLIGFEYARWHADNAVANLISHLEHIAVKTADQPDAIVSIILDGENAWETYPYNGYYFLNGLYKHLAVHPNLNLTTYKKHLTTHPAEHKLAKITAGSWVHGTFSTWIGDPGKNRAWELLADAKQAFDEVINAGQLDEKTVVKAKQELAICEASDWAWWFGDYNPEGAVSDFDEIYRLHLSNLYKTLGVPVPDVLHQVISRGSGDPAVGGVMRAGQADG